MARLQMTRSCSGPTPSWWADHSSGRGPTCTRGPLPRGGAGGGAGRGRASAGTLRGRTDTAPAELPPGRSVSGGVTLGTSVFLVKSCDASSVSGKLSKCRKVARPRFKTELSVLHGKRLVKSAALAETQAATAAGTDSTTESDEPGAGCRVFHLLRPRVITVTCREEQAEASASDQEAGEPRQEGGRCRG